MEVGYESGFAKKSELVESPYLARALSVCALPNQMKGATQ